MLRLIEQSGFLIAFIKPSELEFISADNRFNNQEY